MDTELVEREQPRQRWQILAAMLRADDEGLVGAVRRVAMDDTAGAELFGEKACRFGPHGGFVAQRMEHVAEPGQESLRLALSTRLDAPHAFGDVAREDRDAALVGGVGIDLEDHLAAIAQVVLPQVLLSAFGDDASVGLVDLPIVRVGERVPMRESDHFLPAAPRHALGRRIDRHDTQVLVENAMRVVHPVEDARGALLGARQRLLSQHRLRDVQHLVQQEAHAAVRPEHRHVQRAPVALLPRPVDAAQVVALDLHAVRRPRAQHRLQRGAQVLDAGRFGVVRVRIREDLEQRTADGRFARRHRRSETLVAREQHGEARRIRGEEQVHAGRRREDGDQVGGRQDAVGVRRGGLIRVLQSHLR